MAPLSALSIQAVYSSPADMSLPVPLMPLSSVCQNPPLSCSLGYRDCLPDHTDLPSAAANPFAKRLDEIIASAAWRMSGGGPAAPVLGAGPGDANMVSLSARAAGVPARRGRRRAKGARVWARPGTSGKFGVRGKRDVSSVELLMKYHQGIKAEMEARNQNYANCVDLGNVLLARRHPASEEIKESLAQLSERRIEMIDKWENRWDWLRLLLEVCQFARDASVAEAWLIAQESYLASCDYGNSVNDVEKLLKRHEAFEKSTATWEERFAALERLTTLELLEIRKHQEAARLKVSRAGDREHEHEPQIHHREDREDRGEMSVSEQHSRQTTEQPTRMAGAEETDLVNMSQSTEEAQMEAERQIRHEQEMKDLTHTVLQAPTSEIQEAPTPPAEPDSSLGIQMKGYLGRKHDLEGPNKRAARRSWNTLYCVLQNSELSFYKDAKSFDSSTPFHGEEPLLLTNAVCEAAGDYKKKKYVFRLKLSNGNEWLFHGKDEEERDNWIQILTMAIPSARPQRMTQSLPLPSTTSSDGKKEKEKRFSFFPPKK